LFCPKIGIRRLGYRIVGMTKARLGCFFLSPLILALELHLRKSFSVKEDESWREGQTTSRQSGYYLTTSPVGQVRIVMQEFLVASADGPIIRTPDLRR